MRTSTKKAKQGAESSQPEAPLPSSALYPPTLTNIRAVTQNAKTFLKSRGIPWPLCVLSRVAKSELVARGGMGSEKGDPDQDNGT
ncbi:hypothetical protein TNCV_4491511 [Trichonephila clavipes]|nr:hypothetical protein TNCV_4491511 [Trichonephila clavipes]